VSQWLNLILIQSPASPTSNSPATKKDPNAPQPTPLEKLLADAGPIRGDGSDKFFGFENVSSLTPSCAQVRLLIAYLSQFGSTWYLNLSTCSDVIKYLHAYS